MAKKIFISQPMKGKTDDFIREEREKAIALAKERIGEEAEVLDTFFQDFNASEAKNKPLAFLARSLSFLADADVAVFASGWADARGCRIEHQCAVDYGIDVIEL